MEEWVTSLLDHARKALRPVEGKLEFSALEGDVEILTDRWGIPHVYAASLADLYFAQGFLHATERLFQVDLNRRLAQGRLSELMGEFTLPLDRFFRTLGLGRTARKFAQEIDDHTRSVAEPYGAGFRAGIDSLPRPAEYEFLGLDPELATGTDEAVEATFSIALLMAFVLSPNWEFELLRLRLTQTLGSERARQLSPFVNGEPPLAIPASTNFNTLSGELARAAQAAGKVAGTGSNNWVVAGTRSTTGKPILCNDPHLRIQMPAIWMEMHLACPDLEASGVTLPGVPGIVIGHNRRIAWGFTNTQSDVSDLYLERLSDDGSRYEYAGEWRDVEVITEEIGVRGESTARTHEVRVTHHGPLLDSTIEGQVDPEIKEGSIPEALAFRWIHYDVVPSQASIEGLNRAENFDDFREAARLWPAAGQNMIYADVDGNIGYQFTGTVPLRAKGSGAAPLPGWTGEHEWVGTIPFEDLPWALNPESGYIATANNRVVDYDYPHYLTNDWELSFRIRRITHLIQSREKHSIDDMRRLQADTHSGVADSLLPFALELKSREEPARHALALLASWDRRMDASSAGGALFMAWVSRIAAAIFESKLGPDLFDSYFRRRAWTTLWACDALASILRDPDPFWVGGNGHDQVAARDRLIVRTLEEAWDDVSGRLGNDPTAWRWGSLHTLHSRHPLATAMPLLDEVLSAGPFESPGSDDTINRGSFNPGEGYQQSAVSSYRQIVDLSNFDNSLAIVTSGTSGNPASPHYRDQAEAWLACEYHPVPFSRESVEDAVEGRLLLTPA